METPDSLLTLVLLGREQQLPFEELAPQTSPYTGRRLRCVSISFSVPKEESDEIASTVAKAREPHDALAAADGTRWLVTESSYSYEDGSCVHRHHAELRELEHVQADRLEFLGVAVEPLRYREDMHGDGILMVEAIVAPDAAVDERIEQAVRDGKETGYFELVRVGVREQPLRVRFGRCLWQKSENGRQHLLRFVADEGAKAQSPVWFLQDQPEKGRVARTAFEANEGVAALLEELRRSGVLGDEAIASVRARMDGAPKERAREVDEAEDLGLHFEP